jgi:hypothetical protein
MNNYFCALYERNLETTINLFTECLYYLVVWTLVANCKLERLPNFAPLTMEKGSKHGELVLLANSQR